MRISTIASGGLATMLALVGGQASAAMTAEAAFQAARAWTVRVQVELPIPFIEDEHGAFEGAGFVVDAERGWIMTNAHVAGHSPADLQIAFEDGRLIPAKPVYVDPHLDVAIISYLPAQLKRPPLEPTLDCESIPPIGHPVGTFGHPWGYRFTGTRGIASAVSSRIGADMLQTDAPINAGNSGGPLISLETGRVVGINTAKIASEEVEGLSFAVPMRYACTILKLLKSRRDPSPPVARVEFALDENEERSLFVGRSRLSPTDIDLRPGDVIVAVHGKSVTTPTQLIDALRGSTDHVLLTVRRGGKEMRISGRLPPAPLVTERQGISIDGALIAPVEEVYSGWLGDGEGLMVHYVDEASEAQSVGVQFLDVIDRVNGRPAKTLKQLEQTVADAKRSGRRLEIVSIRMMEEGSKVFEYQRRFLSGEDVEWVGVNRN